MGQEPSNVVLSLERVRRLDCSGLGQLVRLHNRVSESGSLFTLVNIDPRQRQLLKILMLKNLFYHWRTNLAVILGVVAGTAVISGALVVGDSVRYSLKKMHLRKASRF